MKIITTANATDYYAWFAKALVDDGVWPYLSMTPRCVPAKVEDDDWERRIIMDDLGVGVGYLIFDRTGERSAALCLWVLSQWVSSSGSNAERTLIASSLLRDLLVLGSRYDLQWIDSTVHESNEKSVRINSKFFGAPWGIQPAGAWNGKLREYENRLCFRAPIERMRARFDQDQIVDAVANKTRAIAS